MRGLAPLSVVATATALFASVVGCGNRRGGNMATSQPVPGAAGLPSGTPGGR